MRGIYWRTTPAMLTRQCARRCIVRYSEVRLISSAVADEEHQRNINARESSIKTLTSEVATDALAAEIR
jgi:hypothetical protein